MSKRNTVKSEGSGGTREKKEKERQASTAVKEKTQQKMKVLNGGGAASCKYAEIDRFKFLEVFPL